MKIRNAFVSTVLAATVGLTGLATMTSADAATAAVSVKLTHKLTNTHVATVKFCNNLDESVDVWVGKSRSESDTYRRIWPNKCAVIKTTRSKLGYNAYTRFFDVESGVLNTRTGSVRYIVR